MTWLCMNSQGSCVKRQSPITSEGVDYAPGSGGPITISAPVGLNGKNTPDDVITIQDALNRVPTRQGGASPPLVLDGKCGPKTRGAIQNFQLYHFGWKGADGLIEPNKQTIARINQILGTEPLLPNLDLYIQKALSWVSRAQYNVWRAANAVDDKNAFDRQGKMRLLNRHFALDSNPLKGQAYSRIRDTYNRMQQVFHRPGGLWGSAAFQEDPVQKWVAYTFWAGYFRGGQFHYEVGRKMALDSIYICKRFYEMPEEKRSFVIVHELAHFVGHPMHIDDFAYNYDNNGEKIAKLSPELKSLNAENYANFAYEAGTGRETLMR